MKPIPDIPELRIVSSSDLQPHEYVDPNRARRLIHSLRNEGYLKNPPVVLPLGAESPRYVVLDGANRTTAFQQMGFPHMLVQVAHGGVQVRSWNHALIGDDLSALAEQIDALDSIRLIELPKDEAAQRLADHNGVAYLAKPDGSALLATAEGETEAEQVEALGRIVDTCIRDHRTERTSASNLNGLTSIYPDLVCLVVYRRFSVNEVVEVVGRGGLFPSGLTRFLISPRALRLNFPIAMLADRSSLESKERALEDWIHRRVDQQRVRYYAESTFLFDE